MKGKLLKKLDGRTIISFWRKHIKDQCNLEYATFTSQLSGTLTMRDDVKIIVQDYLSGKGAK